jgi:hypothetical protein
MEAVSEANLIVERMLVDYCTTPEEDREALPGGKQAHAAWELISKELAAASKAELVDAFLADPHKNLPFLVNNLARLMRRSEGLARQLREILDDYLTLTYAKSINVSQNVSDVSISNASGLTKGGTQIGLDFDSLTGKKSKQ